MKKGFTLIELLAVLIILAVILLIAVPIVQKIIYDSEVSARKASMELYIRAVDQAIQDYQLNENDEPHKFSDIEEYIKYSGDKVECTTKLINPDISIYLSECSVGGKELEGYSYGQEPKTYENGEVVYFDVVEGVRCYDYSNVNSLTGYNGLESRKTVENQNSCLKFYAFNDSEKKTTVNLILDHNTTLSTVWASASYGSKGPDVLLENLVNDTTGWSDRIETPVSYSLDNRNNGGVAHYTVNYTTKARIIAAHEIAQIIGYEGWNDNSAKESFYFDSKSSTASSTCQKGNTSECRYGWLYDRTSNDCEVYGCLNNTDDLTKGYWTVTIYTNSGLKSFVVRNYGDLFNSGNYDETSFGGVRPVITVEKSLLN